MSETDEGGRTEAPAQQAADGSEEVAALQPQGRCLPRCLQRLVNGPKVFALWLTMYIVLKVASGIYTGAILNTMEKQFKLSRSATVPIPFRGGGRHGFTRTLSVLCFLHANLHVLSN